MSVLQDKFVHVYLVKPVYKNDRSGEVLYLCDCETMHQSVETLRGYVCSSDEEEGGWTGGALRPHNWIDVPNLRVCGACRREGMV